MLDPDLRAVLAEIAAGPADPPLTPETMWAVRAVQHRHVAWGVPYEEVAAVTERVVDGRDGPIRVKLYDPLGAGDAATPAILRIHGGGMVSGSPEFEDRSSRMLANALGARVVGVAYRLAPEHPWPAGLHDCIDALRWLHAEAATLGVDPERLAVLGHSAGALLALSCAIALRGEAPRVRRWVALEPTTGPLLETRSRAEHGDGTYLLGVEESNRCWELYLQGAAPTTPTAAPALATEDDLRGLDPVAVLTAEYDPLRDEGEAFARQLAAAGVDVEQRRFDGLVHGSTDFAGRVPAAHAVLDEIVRLLRADFAPERRQTA
ncbi:MAG TPA: alpha/beta hydrolase [Conexibacter sp.]|jgi:acetyl esterase|nr:alpha/beta hydrolase [Conexibacter sp.]